ncbi:MAG TPA: DUF6112 family protein [Acidimicrobiia bacterium]|nr:DUF6112 family protein [Acidimicrobiia bacterium]
MLGTAFQSVGRRAEDIIIRNGGDRNAPGFAELKDLTATIRTWSIVACVIAIIIAAILWAWGAQSQNAAQATQGKKGIIVAVAAAAIIFAAEAMVNWGTGLGGTVNSK